MKGLYKILIIIFAFSPNLVHAQIINAPPLETPVRFVLPKSQVLTDTLGDVKEGFPWIVYSDRNDNQTYKDTLLTEEKKIMDFLEAFYVIENRNNIIHIIKDTDYEKGKFSFTAEDYGWVAKDKMLLWQHCYVSKTGNLNLKGLVQNTLTEVKQERTEQGVTYYYNPALKSKSEKLSRSFEVLYIYKIDGNALLLGKSPSFYEMNAKDKIFGWIQKNKVTQWEHNLALEVNWDEQAAQERKDTEKPAYFFYDKPRAKKYGEGEKITIKLIFWDQDTYDKRPAGDIWRFPVLEVDTAENVIKANVFNSTVGETSILRSLVPKMSTFSGAFTPIKMEGSEYPMFNYVFLLTKTELSDVIKALQQASEIKTSNYNIREKLYNYWEKELDEKGVYKQDINIDSLTFNDISKLMYNHECIYELSDYYLINLLQPPYVSDNVINNYLDALDSKLKELNTILNTDKYEYGFRSFDLQYYWIDRRLFPL